MKSLRLPLTSTQERILLEIAVNGMACNVTAAQAVWLHEVTEIAIQRERVRGEPTMAYSLYPSDTAPLAWSALKLVSRQPPELRKHTKWWDAVRDNPNCAFLGKTEENPHEWGDYPCLPQFKVCVNCGAVERKEGRQSNCSGAKKVELR